MEELGVQLVVQSTVVQWRLTSVTHRVAELIAELFVTLWIQHHVLNSVLLHMVETQTVMVDLVVITLEDVNQTVTVDRFQLIDFHQE